MSKGRTLSWALANPVIPEDRDGARSLLKQIVQKLPDEESKRLDKIRRTRRQHIREVGAALALVAALVGGGLLAVLLSPVWAQIITEENMETGACRDSGTCKEWRVVFAISAAFSFAMAVITLIMTIVVVLGMHQLLALAISAFILCLDSMSLALVASAYMTYPRSAAISSAVIMFLLGIFTLVVVAVPGAVLSWHLIFRLNPETKNTKDGDDDQRTSENHNNGSSQNSTRYRGPTGKVGEDVLIHQAVKKDSWRYRLLLQMALANGEDPDRPSAEGITPLMLACINEQDWAIDKLLEEGADRRMLQKDMAYLVVQCRALHKEHMIENLQSKGVDFSRSIFYEIMVSSPHNKLDDNTINMRLAHLHELIQELDINLREFSTGFTPLHFAVIQQNTRAVMELVDAPGIRLDIHDNEGYTALHRCLVQPEINFDVLEGLLGCPHIDVVQETGKINNTSLHLAVASGSQRAVEMILHAIVSGNSSTSGTQEDALVNNSPLMSEVVNKNNDARKSALHLAVEGGHLDIVKTLLQHNGDPRRRNDEECNCLLIAAQHGHSSVVSLLLDSGKVDPNVCGKREGKTALHFACSARSFPTVRELLRKPEVRKNINVGDKAGFTALHHAVESGCFDIVRLLLKVDEIDPNEPSNDDRYPIHLAASKKDAAILKLLMDHKKTNINVCGSAGQTALDIAKELGHKEIESILVSRNGMRASDVDVSMNLSKIDVDTVLHRLFELTDTRFATEDEVSEKVREFLEKGNDINVRDENGRTALHIAAKGGYLETFKALLNQEGIKVNAEDKKGYTPLHIACKKGNLLVVKELLGLNQAANASDTCEASKRNTLRSFGTKDLRHTLRFTNQETPKRRSFKSNRNVQKMAEEVKSELENETKELRRTPLELAIEHGHFEIAEILLEQGADIHHTANDGMGCLHLACLKGDLKMVQKLLDMNIKIKGQDDLGKTELHYACESGNVDVVDVLLQLPGIEVNKHDHDWQTPWHLVVSQDHPNASKILKRLLSYPGIEVNKQGPQEKSALHLAVETGNVDTVKVILAAPGININARDKDGMTPLHVGARKANGEIVSLLIKTHPKDIDVNIRNNNGLTPLDAAFAAGNTKGKNILRKHGALRSVQLSHNRSSNKSMNLTQSSRASGYSGLIDLEDLDV